MQYKPQPKNRLGLTVTIITILIVSFLAYDYFSINNSRAATDLEGTASAEAVGNRSPFSPQQLAMLAKIEMLKLDDTLFKDAAFSSLQDWTVELGREDIGRTNPFAAVGGMSSAPPSTKPTPSRR